MLLAQIVHIIASVGVLLFFLRMFMSPRDAYFNPFIGGIYRTTNPVMEPLHRSLRKKPADTAAVDYLALVPIFILMLADGILTGMLIPGMSISLGIITALSKYVDGAFVILVILVLTFSVFIKHARYTGNAFVRTGFRIMEPIYVFIGKYMPPLKKWPGLTVFSLGLIVHFVLTTLIVSMINMGNAQLAENPGLMLSGSFLHSIRTLLWLFTFFTWTIIISALMSWVSPDPNNPIVELIRLMSEPINKPFRKVIPTMGGIDISPIFSILTLQVIGSLATQLLNELTVRMLA